MNVTWDSRGSSKISERPCALLVILFWFHQPYPTFWSQECPGQDSDLEADLAKTGRFGPGWLEGGAVGPEKNEEPDL